MHSPGAAPILHPWAHNTLPESRVWRSEILVWSWLDRLRRPRPRRLGLALGGGGARGFAHVGVLRELERAGVCVDVVVGTSVGALIGALYADGHTADEVATLAMEVERDDFFDFGPRSLLAGGLARGKRIEGFVASHTRTAAIEDLPTRFAAVAVVLRTGEVTVFDHGPVARAVRASCTIPGVFAPVEIDGVTYVDGAVVAPVPAHIAHALGADVVIAVAIPAAVPEESPRTPVGIFLHAVDIMSAEIGRLHARAAEVVIVPDVGDIAIDDFSQKPRLIEAGAAATRAALPRIRAALGA